MNMPISDSKLKKQQFHMVQTNRLDKVVNY